MVRLSALVSCALVALAASAGSPSQLRATSFIRSLDFKHVLRICNVYPYDAALDVYMGKEKLNAAELAYKDCAEFSPKLAAGAKLDFKVADSTVGTFTISELPQSDAVLFMAIFRHDSTSTAVSFESHVFAPSEQSQVAVVDTYKGGTEQSELRIEDQKAKKKGEVRSELLRYDSVVAVTPGLYDVVLTKPSGEKGAQGELVAKEREAYTVMRVGLAASAEGAASYPEEVVVFPRSDPAEFEKDSALGSRLGVFAVLASLLAASH